MNVTYGKLLVKCFSCVGFQGSDGTLEEYDTKCLVFSRKVVELLDTTATSLCQRNNSEPTARERDGTPQSSPVISS